jgi:hypothetical protein
MQQTLSSLILQAVVSFPKQSLGEWILYYSLQTILTTVHLILTHEINELFYGTQNINQAKREEISCGESPRGGPAADMHFEYGLMQGGYSPHIAEINRTPDTRDMIRATASNPAASHGCAPGNQMTVSVQQLNEDFLKEVTKLGH